MIFHFQPVDISFILYKSSESGHKALSGELNLRGKTTGSVGGPQPSNTHTISCTARGVYIRLDVYLSLHEISNQDLFLMVLYIRLYTPKHTYTDICMNLYKYMYMYVYIYIYMCVCLCVFIYTYLC